jgi:hypothetical protein
MFRDLPRPCQGIADFAPSTPQDEHHGCTNRDPLRGALQPSRDRWPQLDSYARKCPYNATSCGSQSPVDRMAPWQEGDDRESPLPEGGDRLLDLIVSRIDHLSSAQIAESLRTPTEVQVNLCQIQIELWIEKFLTRSLFAERARFAEGTIRTRHSEPQKGSDLCVFRGL